MYATTQTAGSAHVCTPMEITIMSAITQAVKQQPLQPRHPLLQLPRQHQPLPLQLPQPQPQRQSVSIL